MSEFQVISVVVTNLLAAALVPIVLLVAALRDRRPAEKTFPVSLAGQPGRSMS